MIPCPLIYGIKIPAWTGKGIGSSAGGRAVLQGAVRILWKAENIFFSETNCICYTERMSNTISNKTSWPLFSVNVFFVTVGLQIGQQ